MPSALRGGIVQDASYISFSAPPMSTSIRQSRETAIVALPVWLAVSFVAAAAGGIASASAPVFYAQLAKPAWAPPAWLFGPAWTVLFVLMGVAAWLVWRERGHPRARTGLTLFVVQLVFNALWSWLFFAWRRGDLALAEVVVLELLIVATMVAFWRVRPLAGALMIPYALWVAYATALTAAVWRMNPTLL
ncbi:MAG TPA: TspO/MBR family protein [Longimicrobium sp.]|nr:TspO/MBR family protein [Longimicrobium sp.]